VCDEVLLSNGMTSQLVPNEHPHYLFIVSFITSCIIMIHCFFRHRDNIALVKKWREAVGPDFPIMIDCYMSLTLPYAIELARKCEPYNVKWIEETLPPDDYEGYSELKKAVKTTLITTGEHEYTRECSARVRNPTFVLFVRLI